MLDYEGVDAFLLMVVPAEDTLKNIFSLLDYKSADDIPVTTAVYVAVIYSAFRYLAQFLLSFVFYHLVPNDDKRLENSKRCSESAVKLMFYSFSWCWLVSVVKGLGIWEDLLSTIEFFPYPVSYSIMGVYMWELGFYISGLMCHFTIETRRKDFWEMALHHLVTIILIGGSVYMQYERIGLIILMLHDISDVFLETGKIFTYLGNDPVATVAFLGLIVSWFIARCVYFPLKVLRSVFRDHVGKMQIPYGRHFAALLLILQVLNIFWFGLLMNMAYKKLFEGADIEDTRETEVDKKSTKKSNKKGQ